MAQNEVCPQDEIGDPPGTDLFPIERRGFCWRFRVYSYTVWSAVGASKGREPVFLVCVGLNWTHQVRWHNYYRYCSPGYDEGVSIVPQPKPLSVREGRRSRCLLIGCALLSLIGAKAWLGRSNAIHSRHMKPPSSSKSRQRRMWEFCRHRRWN